jgi:hypothetical protein
MYARGSALEPDRARLDFASPVRRLRPGAGWRCHWRRSHAARRRQPARRSDGLARRCQCRIEYSGRNRLRHAGAVLALAHHTAVQRRINRRRNSARGMRCARSNHASMVEGSINCAPLVSKW